MSEETPTKKRKPKKLAPPKLRKSKPAAEARETMPTAPPKYNAKPGPHPGAGIRKIDFKKKYRTEYCYDLIEHGKRGDPFDCFGAFLAEKYGIEYAVGRSLLYEWLKEHPEFVEAKAASDALNLKFWNDLGKTGTSGQLRRVSKETIAIAPDGKSQIVSREYAPATFGQNSWRLIMSSRFGMSEKTVSEVTGKDGAPIELTAISSEERIRRIKELDQKLLLTSEDEDESGT